MKEFSLDWDDITYHTALQRINLLKQEETINEIILVESPKMSGYHVYVKLHIDLEKTIVLRMRLEYWDDTKRLAMDAIMDKQEVRNVSYQCKIQYKFNKSFLWEETYIEKFINKKYGDKSWLQISLKE